MAYEGFSNRAAEAAQSSILNNPSRWILASFATLLVPLIIVVKFQSFITNPIFTADAGYRVIRSNEVLVELLGRTWLPLLQLHLIVLVQLHASAFWYQSIGIIYAALFAFCWMAVALQHPGRPWISGCLGLLSVLYLLSLPRTSWLMVQPYQEFLCLGLVSLVVLLWFVQAPIQYVAIVAFLAALSREYAWFLALPAAWLAWTEDGKRRHLGIAVLVAFVLVVFIWQTLIGSVPIQPSQISPLEILLRLCRKLGWLHLIIAIIFTILTGILVCLSARQERVTRLLFGFGVLFVALCYSYIIYQTPFLPVDNSRALFPLVMGGASVLAAFVRAVSNIKSNLHSKLVGSVAIIILSIGIGYNFQDHQYSPSSKRLSGIDELFRIKQENKVICLALEDRRIGLALASIVEGLPDKVTRLGDRRCDYIVRQSAAQTGYELPLGVWIEVEEQT